MEQFAQEFLRFRDRMEQALPPDFCEREHSVLIAGRGCALAAGYSLSQERKLFGIAGFGNFTHSHEQRLLYCTPGLRGEQLPEWKAYARNALAERIQLDRAHAFSIFSFLLVTDGIDQALPRVLKKVDFEEKYAAPGAGWAQARFLVVDLPAGKLYPSPLGRPLAGLMRGLV